MPVQQQCALLNNKTIDSELRYERLSECLKILQEIEVVIFTYVHVPISGPT